MKHFALNERACTIYRNVNIGKLRNLNFKYPHKMRQKWQFLGLFGREEKRVRWKKAVAEREALYNFQASFFAAAGAVVMHYNAPHATHPPCMWGSMQIWHGGRNGVTDVRVGSATAACTTNATAALFTYRSQEGWGGRGAKLE